MLFLSVFIKNQREKKMIEKIKMEKIIILYKKLPFIKKVLPYRKI